MAKKTTPTYSVGSMDEYSSFVGSISGSGGKKSEKKVVANATNLSSLNLEVLKDLDEKIYLSQTKVEMNLSGDVGVYNVALLSPRFTRRGFKGRSISLVIPASLDSQSQNMLKERICSFAKEESAAKVRDLLSKGAVISMEDGKQFGLIDSIIDLSKKRGSNVGKTAVVASEGNPASENSIKKE